MLRQHIPAAIVPTALIGALRENSRPEGAGEIWQPVLEHGWVIARRGALAVTAHAVEILRHGIPIALSPTESVLLGLLIRRGRASHEELVAAFRTAGSNPAGLNISVHRIRRKFAAAGAPDPVERLRGWGLRLRVEPDISGSTSLWIGRPAA
ncbi:helix-turn-helix domain-containing protein [Sphingomonas alpina]|uniref:Helix-turn-helix domain-containing protein n=2 Tax=Sphingomonas alpina TaxID=653931 RepID=A0A7H0LF19_9SPHN|nr:helix-turn-helix domain-containing protein [Sphingomonas alpina]QNQ08272.1 helix-turn-helix domain-containing protein [Sphingomonas alpina]